MKKFRSIFFAVVATAALTSLAQNRADRWYFGLNAGIDFTSGTAIALNGGQVNTPEGCSAISDKNTGALLFYTDGISVWDRNHVIMPNGTGLLGSNSSTQAALIVPDPAAAEIYYIFTTDEIGGPNGLRYSKVDMTLQAGLGDVTVKNVLLLGTVTEKLTAVQDELFNYWVLAHEWGNNSYYAYKLTATGVSAPVISNVGTVHDTSVIQNTYGQMKFNTCGTKVACAIGYQDVIEVCDFDIQTGVVSNPLTLPQGDHVYGVEFSPDGTKLYASVYGSQTLFQFDLTLPGGASAINAAKTPLSITPDTYALQLGPDGKIYAVKSFSQFLGVINSPNVAGASCNYVDMGLDLDPNFVGSTASLGLPAFIQSDLIYPLCILLGQKENEIARHLAVYPNPANESFTVSLPENSMSVTVTDITGKIIEVVQVLSDTVTLGEDYAPGVYFIRTGSAVTKAIKD